MLTLTVQIHYNLHNHPTFHIEEISTRQQTTNKKKRVLCWSIFLLVCGYTKVKNCVSCRQHYLLTTFFSEKYLQLWQLRLIQYYLVCNALLFLSIFLVGILLRDCSKSSKFQVKLTPFTSLTFSHLFPHLLLTTFTSLT